MVNISSENREQTHNRLSEVMRNVELVLYDETYYFHEFAMKDFSNSVQANSLAIVKDKDHCSQLVPVRGNVSPPRETFGIFSCHFAAGIDNSGFVGWLATVLKERLGTGVFVICGYNSQAGGVYDYWGYPVTLQKAVVQELRALQAA